MLPNMNRTSTMNLPRPDMTFSQKRSPFYGANRQACSFLKVLLWWRTRSKKCQTCICIYQIYTCIQWVCVYIYIHRILIYCILITSSEGFSFRNSATTREKNLIVLKASTNEGKPCWNVLGFFISQDRMWEIVISFGNQTLHGESTSWGFNAKIIYL